MEVLISFNDAELRHFLKNYSGKLSYIYEGEKKDDICELLKKNNYNKIDLYRLSEDLKSKFVESYTDLIGKLGSGYNSNLWWATNISSKNQFISKTFENLYLYYALISIIEQDNLEDLLIINPPKSIYNSLISYCKKNKVKYHLLKKDAPLSLLGKIKSLYTYCGHRFLFIANIWQKIHIANKFLKGKFKKELRERGNYYVIRTWFYQDTIKRDEYIDSFFGKLPAYLIRQGKGLFILAGVMGEYRFIINSLSTIKNYLIFPPELFLNYLDPFKVILEAFFNRIRIKGRVELDGIDVTEIIKKEIDKEFEGISVLSNYLNFYCVKRLLSMIKFDNFIYIYENNAWERMCILALRKYSPSTYIIGYQHPPLFKAAINMMSSKYEKDILPMPDRINTIGKINKKWLEQYGNYNTSIIRESCALRLGDFHLVELAPRKTLHKILLILGGINNRAIEMVNFVYQGLKETSRYKLIIRPHPALPFQYISKKLNFNISSARNFFISKHESVLNDLEGADIVLYDASTIAMQALYMGIPVIHIALDDILSFDPLYDCSYLKWTVAKEEDLIPTIEAIYGLSEGEFSRQQRGAQEFIKDYVYPVTEEGLSKFIV